MGEPARLLAAYDDQLRTDAETPSAISVAHLVSLRLVTFPGGRGFVTYRDLGGADTNTIRRLVAEVLTHDEADPEITRVEWKTRGHDHAPGLREALLDNGFVPDEPESIMIGEAQQLRRRGRAARGCEAAASHPRGGGSRDERDGGRGLRRPRLRANGRRAAVDGGCDHLRRVRG